MVQTRLKMTFISSVVLLAAVFALAGWSVFKLKSAIQLRKQAFVLQTKIDDLYEAIQDADNAFLQLKISSSEADFEKFNLSLKEASEYMQDLVSLQVYDPDVYRSIIELSRILEEKINISQNLAVSEDLYDGVQLKKVYTIKNDLFLTETVKDLVSEIYQKVDSDLKEHEQFLDKYFGFFIFLFSAAFFLALFFFMLFARQNNNEIERRSNLESELRLAQKEAVAASELKSQFLATVSHEIRTPLNGIMGISEILVERASNSELKRFANLIKVSSQTLLRLVNDLLDFSKIEANRLDFEIQEIDLGDLIEKSIDLYSTNAKEKNLSLSATYDSRLKNKFAIDGSRISQILNNLIGNAVKFTSSGKIHVDVTLKSAEASSCVLLFKVTDTGPGILPDRQKTLFQPFARATTHQHEGAGLGLAISKRISELMGGQIGLESSTPSGSIFWFSIPARLVAGAKLDEGIPGQVQYEPKSFLGSTQEIIEDRESGMPKARNTTTLGSQRRRVLLAEDNPTNQILAKSQLESLGYSVQLASNGEEAVAAIQADSFDVVLMDCRMPLLDGFEATRQIRKYEKQSGTKRVPIIAVTANAIAEEQRKCFESGMDDFLAKPINFNLLHSKIDVLTGGQSRVNWFKLKELAQKTNVDVARKLIESFKKTLKDSESKIKTAVSAKSFSDVSAVCHMLRSSSSALGADDLANRCQQIENEIIEKGSCDTIHILALEETIQDALKQFEAQSLFS